MASQSEDIKKAALVLHLKLAGKVTVKAKAKLSKASLAKLYTPGVGAVSTYLKDHPAELKRYTIKSNAVAIISDGSAVLGLGNTGAGPALPVMEGKALLMSELAGIDAFPIVLATQDTKAIIETIVNIAPVFGAINLEDIAAPQCFEIEARLNERLDIPVVHDDQHATAIVVLAGLINAFKVVKKDLKKAKIVIIGAGAAGSGITRLLATYGVKELLVVDSKGILSKNRHDLNPAKKSLLARSNPANIDGPANSAFESADAAVAVSAPGAVTAANIKAMAKSPIIFALANPTPEIMPNEAFKAGAAVVATGRSDFANQINNVLVFPGLFRGLLDYTVKGSLDSIKLNAALALAGLIGKPTAKNIVPSVFDKRVVPTVARAVKTA